MDFEKAIRMAVDTGKVEFGSQRALKLALLGGAKLVIVSSNCPADVLADLRHFTKLSKVHIMDYRGTSVELGTVCGKPFPVSALSVVEQGDSNILEGA
jgi:large subunit ribosomal protein L30e